MTSKKDCIRIFIATFFEKEAISLIEPLRSLDDETSLYLKKVSPEKIHLTWKFIGDFSVSRVQDLVNEVDEAAKSIEKASLNMTGIEIWPNRRNPRQIVITSDKERPMIDSFFNILDNRLYKLDIAKESRRFNPHITIARFKKNVKYNGLLLQALENFAPQRLNINNIKIVQSNLSCSGPEYKVLHDITLLD